MEIPSKEAIRKAKKSIANKKFRDSQKAEKESTDETESATSDSKSTTSSSFFFHLRQNLQNNAINVMMWTVIPLIAKAALSRMTLNTFNMSKPSPDSSTKSEQAGTNTFKLDTLPANF